MNDLDQAGAVARRLSVAISSELAEAPRQVVLAGVVTVTVELFRQFGAGSLLSYALRAEADRIDRMECLDTAASPHSKSGA